MSPSGTLGQLMAAAAERGAGLADRKLELQKLARAAAPVAPLETALRNDEVSLIAEIKRSSPSRGQISPGLVAPAQASAYERGGAAAISVLTEPDHFGGSANDLELTAHATSLPILRKDFHVAVEQLYEARALGASAALLIVRALAPDRFVPLVRAAGEIGLEIVAEVRDLAELDRALHAGCRIIGVNNRNLETLAIEEGTAEALIPRIPADCIAIAESGYSDRRSIEVLAACGADAVLIGSFLSAASDPEAAVRSLTGVPRVARGQ